MHHSLIPNQPSTSPRLRDGGTYSSAHLQLSVLALILFLVRTASAGQISSTFSGRAIVDSVYLQEVGQSFPTTFPLISVAVLDDQVWVGHQNGLLRLVGSEWQAPTGQSPTQSIRRLKTAGGRLWAMTDGETWVYDKAAWQRLGPIPIADLTEHHGAVVAAQGDRLVRLAADGGKQWQPLADQKAPFPIHRLVSHQGSLVLAGQGRLTHLNRGRFGGLDTYGFPSDQAWDWGTLISPNVRDLVGALGALWMGTDRGLERLRGMTLESITGAEGLPIEPITCLATGNFQDLWMGTAQGLIRHHSGDFSYYAGKRWLPGNEVRAIALASNAVYCATDGGLGILRLEPYTLAKKADYYEQVLEAWGMKRLGFTHKLEWDESTGTWLREVSDNDGGYSGDYLAAQSYRWAVTRDPAARREATNTFHALRWLEHMTGVPGLPARAVWAKGEPGRKSAVGSGGYPAEWHDTRDGAFEWKGDTSSDEICSHFYSIGLFLELAAEGAEIEQAKRHLGRLAKHLIDHQWKLVDSDGKPTRWGRWDPEYFKTDEGRFDRGLQALEVLSFMKAAAHYTGDATFASAYQQLVQLGYPDYTLRQRSTFPPEDMAHFEDQLAFWCWWNLLRFEEDPDLKSLYQRGYERSFETVRVEHNPWYNFVYIALTGNVGEEEPAVAHLREWPLDLRLWTFRNSHRADVRTPPGYRTYKGGIRAFSPREREPMRWDAWTLQLDGGADGKQAIECGSWLLAYWMGRHHGLISPPASNRPDHVRARHDEIPKGGAPSYQGPSRPALP